MNILAANANNLTNIESYQSYKASPSWNKHGELITKSRHFKRVLALRGEDQRFYISAQKNEVNHATGMLANAKRFWHSLFYVQVEINSQDEDQSSFALRLSSLSKRCHLSEKKIKQLAQSGPEQLLRTLAERCEYLATSIDCYQGACHYYTPHRDELISRFSQEDIHIKKAFLMKAIKKSYRNFPLEDKSNAFYVDKKILIAHHCSERGLRLFQRTDCILGKGGSAEVEEVINLVKGKKKAFKMASLTDPNFSKVQQVLTNEYNMLKFLHTRNQTKINPIGIQKEGTDLIEVNDTVWGLITKRYHGNYQSRLETIPANLGDKVYDMYQFLAGCCYLQERDVLHGDIKLENILYSQDRNQNISKVVIADFGLSRVVPQAFPGEVPIMGGTSLYMSILDVHERVRLKNEIETICTQIEDLNLQDQNPFNVESLKNLSEDLENAWERLKQLDAAREVFSIGIVLYLTFNSEGLMYPFPIATFKERDYQNAQQDLSMDNLKNLPMGLSVLIQSMLKSNWRQRPKIETAFETFKYYIEFLHSDVKAKIEKDFDQW